MFDELDEGGLATFRSTMVQNKNLAVLAKVWLHSLLESFEELCLYVVGLSPPETAMNNFFSIENDDVLFI